MRVLVVGTLPPPGGAEAIAFARRAAALCENDPNTTTLEMLSPDPRSAAHRSADLGGPRLAAWLILLSRRFDALVLRIEQGLPLRPEAGRLERTVALGALGVAVSRFSDVTIVCNSPIPLPGGVGGRATNALWRHASRVVVKNEDDAALLAAVPFLEKGRILVEPDALVGEAERADVIDFDGELAEDVLRVVRRRARRDRELDQTRSALGPNLSQLTAAFGFSAPVAETPWLRAGVRLGVRRFVERVKR